MNEISPDPASGDEWIEIVSTDPSQNISLTGCTLRTPTRTIYTFGPTTLDPSSPRYALAVMSSSKLNNDGTTVSLFDPNGYLINSVSYAKTAKGKSWIRWPDITGSWQLTLTPTPGEANLLTLPTSTQAETTTTSTNSTDTNPTNTALTDVATSTSAANIPSAATQNATADSSEPSTADSESSGQTTSVEYIEPETIESAAIDDTVQPPSSHTVSTKSSSAQKAETPKRATSTTRTSPSPKTTSQPSDSVHVPPTISSSFPDMQHVSATDVRVRLQGTVGSQPGLLSKHGFILLSNDGRGLYISIPTARELPAIGSHIELSGALHFTDGNTPYLSMSSKDTWLIKQVASTNILPRTVDLIAPSVEDAWSFVQVTGTVDHVMTSSFHLDLTDASVSVSIRPPVNYNLKQLKPGDTVTVSGLLDTSGSEPTILPRASDAISIIRHTQPAQLTATASTTSPLTGWTPFGAAGGALAVVEGAKQLQRRRLKKALTKKLTEIAS
jgi:hypothetical protein